MIQQKLYIQKHFLRQVTRIILLLLIFQSLISYSIFAQEPLCLTGRVIDSKTNNPIPFATVNLNNDFYGVVSNEDGSFRLLVNSKDTNISVKIRCIGYDQLVVNISKFDLQSVQVFRLNSKSYQIKEVEIKGEKQIKKSAAEIVTLAVSRIKSNFPNYPFLLGGYYRDYIKIDSSYINLYEAIVDVEDMGFNTCEREQSKIRLIYGAMNKSFPIDSSKIIGYGKNKSIPYGIINFPGGNEFSFLLLHNPIRNFNYKSFDFIKYIQSDFLKDHIFTNAGIEVIDDTSYYHIEFKYFNAKSNEYATGSVTSIIGGKQLYNDYKANGHIYIQTNNYKIHKLIYRVYYDKMKLWDLNLEYRDKQGVSFLNYLSFNNVVEFSDFNNKRFFYMQKLLLDKKLEQIILVFNNKVDSLSALNRKNYKLEFDGSRLKVMKISVLDSSVIIQINDFERLLGAFEMKYANRFNINLKNIKDNLGNRINEAKTGKAYQYREFFVNKTNLVFDSIPKEQCLDRTKSMIYNRYGTMPDSIIFNTPLY